MVTHNIEEAVLFADRVIVLGTNPGRIKAEIAIDLDRPRDRRAPEFEGLLDRLYGIMTGREAAAHAAPAATGATDGPDARPVMLPHASVDGFSGLLEILRDAAAPPTSPTSPTTSRSRSTTCCRSSTRASCSAS